MIKPIAVFLYIIIIITKKDVIHQLNSRFSLTLTNDGIEYDYG